MRVPCTVVLALTLALSGFAQDKSETCGAAGLTCPKNGKCEGHQREVCGQVAATLKAVRARIGQIMTKECGGACEHCTGNCTDEACSFCQQLRSEVFAPAMKQYVAAHAKGFKHAVKGEDGKTRQVACSFPKEVCDTCVIEAAELAFKKVAKLVGYSK